MDGQHVEKRSPKNENRDSIVQVERCGAKIRLASAWQARKCGA
jgi:hypothetical protein